MPGGACRMVWGLCGDVCTGVVVCDVGLVCVVVCVSCMPGGVCRMVACVGVVACGVGFVCVVVCFLYAWWCV